MNRFLLAAAVVCLFLFSTPVWSQDDTTLGVWGLPYKPGWTVRGGVSALLFPAYEGAKHYLIWPIPSFEADYNDRLYANDWSATYAVFQNKWFSIGPELTPYLGRSERQSDALKGVGDLPYDLKGGAFAALHTPIGHLVVEGSRSMTTSVGATGSVSVQSGYLFDVHRLWLSVIAGVTCADHDYMQSNFGITPDQSVHSVYPVYSPKAGFYNYFLNLAPTFIIHGTHYLVPSIAYIREINDARRSPLVEGAGTPNQFIGQLTYQYRFK